ncbi:hypothetical protein FOXB_10564 [Fusarium oxysporum f. sp. conglutinans Fo5176]|uniref:Uncharacterized protein n=1 Tax=Fusarium oxysporum (strain Fo5176) TaxID=660025 RepID=F9FVY3_FUSOF|nr:hypothetical protein FOXB_10564 [Fusarium oxysporum f. sp. conglutinans Fo5176]
MAPNTSNSVAVYNIVGETEQPASRQCFIRSDDRGLWNDCKSWYIFLIHIRTSHRHHGAGHTDRRPPFQNRIRFNCIHLPFSTISGTGYRPAIPSTCFTQTCCWHWLCTACLEDNLHPSGEARCNACRANPSPQPMCPIIPAVKTETLLRWSLWATAVIILMWPHSFAAPLASSSLSWIPGITLLDIATPALIGEISPHTDWPAILYDDTNRPLGQITFQLPGVEPFDGPLPPDSSISERDRCRTTTKQFGKLPAFGQHQVQIINGDKEIVYYDCYMFAEVAITACTRQETEVVSSDTTSQSYATCSVTRNDGAFGNDWLASLALDFTSESLEYTFLQNFSQPWISPNSDAYVAGMLTLGYHASWSALMKRLWNETEPISFRASDPVVYLAVDRIKLYIWLGMNATLTISAILVFGASMTTRAKTILFIALGPGGFAMPSVSVVRIKNFLGCDGKRAR